MDFANACDYLLEDKHKDLEAKSEEVGRMLNHMIENPKKYLTQKEKLEMRWSFAYWLLLTAYC